jgi:hypothetical protein
MGMAYRIRKSFGDRHLTLHPVVGRNAIMPINQTTFG